MLSKSVEKVKKSEKMRPPSGPPPLDVLGISVEPGTLQNTWALFYNLYYTFYYRIRINKRHTKRDVQ